MVRRDRFLTLLLGAAATIAWSCQGRSQPSSAANPGDAAIPGVTELEVGDAAPEFSLPGSDGKTYSLSDFKGRTVVLMWFAKAFTSA